jgi:hypothetical protein
VGGSTPPAEGCRNRSHEFRARATPPPQDAPGSYLAPLMTDATKPSGTLLDRLLTEAKISNHDVVEAAKGQLSHKNVQKARTGSRPISDLIARQICETANALLQLEEPIKVRALFPGYPRGKAPVAPRAATAETQEEVDGE